MPGEEGWRWRERHLLISHQDRSSPISTLFPVPPPLPPAKFTSHMARVCVSALESSTFELSLLLRRSEPSCGLCKYISKPQFGVEDVRYLTRSFKCDVFHIRWASSVSTALLVLTLSLSVIRRTLEFPER